MSEPRLVVHLGMPKTGTSILQNSVMRALTMPGAAHLIYPDFGRGRRVAHHDLAKQLAEAPEGAAAPLAEELAAVIAAEAAAAPHKRVALCSSEAFVHVCGLKRAPHLAAFIDAFPSAMPVRAVLVIREFAEFTESMYLQSTRFGHLRMDFDDYLARQPQWSGNLLRGALTLQAMLGDRLQIEYQDGGFDILDCFGTILDLPPDLLREASRNVPSTAKMSLKTQIALTHLERLEAELGFEIARARMVRLLEKGDFFNGDTTRYTLYRPGQRRSAHAHFMDIAAAASATGYTRAFAEFRERDLPHVDLDFARLGPEDLKRLTARRDKLALPPQGATDKV